METTQQEEEEKRYPPRSTGLYDKYGDYFIDEGDMVVITRGSEQGKKLEVIWMDDTFCLFSKPYTYTLTQEKIEQLGLQIVSSVEYLLESERG